MTALDIAPASECVLRSDFLSVNISQEEDIDSRYVRGLREDSFHVVIFCLLLGKLFQIIIIFSSNYLEYLPSASQRLKCIENAIKILKVDGLLCIVTPDSSHMGKYVKSEVILTDLLFSQKVITEMSSR